MTPKRILASVGAGAAVAGYWALDAWWGPFDAVRRYGRSDGHNWATEMPAGEWAWYAAGLMALLVVASVWAGMPRRGVEAADRRPWRRVYALASIATLLAATIRLIVLGGAPLADDEMVYRFQARTLASGHLTAAPPPDANAFEHIFLGNWRGRWFGQYGFGHPAWLALGVLLGSAGIVGPLFAGLLVIAVFLLAGEVFDRRTALVAATLAAIGPLFVSTGATLQSQTTTTTLVVFGVYATLRAAETGRFAAALSGALLLGAAFWGRQQEPALLGAGAIAYLAWRIVRERKWAALAGGALGSAIVLAPLAWLQWHLWGHALWTNYQAYWWGYLEFPGKSPYGFGPGPWEIVHTPWAGLRAVAQNLVRLDTFLIGLPLAVPLAAWGLVHHRRDAKAWAVFAGLPLTLVAVFFTFWPGVADTGPLALHGAGAVTLIFAAAGLRELLNRTNRPLAATAAVALAAGVTFWPVQMRALARAADAATELPRVVAAQGATNAVVFTKLYPCAGEPHGSWVMGRPLPWPDLRDDVLYLRTQGKPVDEALAAKLYPTRSTWMLRCVDHKIAMLPLAEYTGAASLRAVAQERKKW